MACSPKGRASKGAKFERSVSEQLAELGIHAPRIPMSGQSMGGGDLLLKIGPDRYGKAECKHKHDAHGFKTIYEWLVGNQILFLRADRKEPLVVMRLSDVGPILTRLQNGENGG